jgi:hypothetical protein
MMDDKDQGAFKLRKATILSTKSYISPEIGNIIDSFDNNSFQGDNLLNRENPEFVVNLMAEHLGKIFVATYRKKLSNAIDNS